MVRLKKQIKINLIKGLDIKKAKALFRFFIFFFLISYLIFNWNDISWVFNYNFLASAFSSLALKEPLKEPEDFEKEEDLIRVGKQTEKEDGIFIPKIGVEAPLVFLEDAENPDFEKGLKRGVVHYPESSLPGEKGTAIFLGHSASLGWPKINYDWVFSNLSQLERGDEVYIFFKNYEYLYTISEKYLLEKGEELPEDLTSDKKSVLVLISCWPPGKNLERIAIVAGIESQ